MMDLLQGSLLLQTCMLSGLVLVGIYVYFRTSFSYWKKRGVPTLNPTVPLGDFTNLFTTNRTDIDRFYKAFAGEKVGGLYKFHKPVLLIRDPEVIKSVFVKDFDSFYSRGIAANEEVEPLVGHLFLLNGPKWRNLRVKLTPTFTSGKMKMMFPTLVETGKELQKFLKNPADNNEVIGIKDILARYSTDIIASCAFGIQCNCLKDPNAEFRVWGRKILNPKISFFINNILVTVIPFLKNYLRISLVSEDVSRYFRNMVKDTVEYREKNNVHKNDFMQLMIQLKNKTLGMTEEDPLLKVPNGAINGLNANSAFEVTMDVIAAQAFVFFVAGFETSSTTMTFCLYEMALNPDIQVRVQEEVDSVLKKYNGNITYEAVQEMEYLDKVVNETLRKHPPVTLITRECTQTTKLGSTDVIIEKGVAVNVPVLQIHRDPKYYPNPEKFDPERFNEEEKRKRHHFTYLPFGEGPRLCIGMRFGLMQTKVGIISILSKYEVRVSEKTTIPMVYDPKSFVLSPVGGMWLKITKRSNNLV